ncbi:MAG: DNA primase [Elusimicrobiota bacterium]
MDAEASREEVRDRSDIVEVVREYIPNLKRAGRSHKACCPFHQEKTPSFTVNPEKQIFHCFGCREGGDVFAFVMKFENMSFPEALEKLAERAGVRLAKPERAQSPQAKERARVRKVLDLAGDFYRAHLEKLPEDAPARKYLAKRRLAPEIMQAFRLGYAPRSGPLRAAAEKKGYAPELLEMAGLVRRQEGRGYRDYFWDRILFPIENAKGETVGFGARTLGDGEPKYLNSPETVVFSKGRVLYGLRAALPAMRKTREALLLEGYMDVLTAHQFGATSACAPLGTALTEEHAVLLKRYVERVMIVFDPDSAGIKAAVRGAEMLVEKGLGVAIAALPDGMDPDELLHERGLAAFKDALAEAYDLPTFKTLQLLKGKPRPLPAAEKSRIAAEVLETIRRSPDEILKSEWIRGLAERLEVDEQSLYLELKKGADKPPARRADRASLGEPVRPLPVIERDILFYLFRSPGLAVDDELVAESDLNDERARRIFAGMRKALQGEGGQPEGGEWTSRLWEALAEGEAALAREILCDEREVGDPAGVLARIVRKRRKARRLAEIEPSVLAGENGHPVDPQVLKEYTQLLSELKGTQKGE